MEKLRLSPVITIEVRKTIWGMAERESKIEKLTQLRLPKGLDRTSLWLIGISSLLKLKLHQLSIKDLNLNFN